MNTSTAVPMISQGQTADFLIALPSTNEQAQIVEHLNAETTRIDTEINNISKETTLLEEYRQSLITEVVTGKLDVRALKQ